MERKVLKSIAFYIENENQTEFEFQIKSIDVISC